MKLNLAPTLIASVLSIAMTATAFTKETALQASQKFISLSAVNGHQAQSAQVVITNTSEEPVECDLKLVGTNPDAFELSQVPERLAPGKSAEITVTFRKTEKAFRHSASLQLGPKGQGGAITLQGIGQQQFEGKNEPPLQDIVNTFGMAIKVGGSHLHLDTKAQTLGESIVAAEFNGIAGKQIRLTPLARYSPTGAAPFGCFIEGTKHELGKLVDSSEAFPDAHQCLFPRIVGNKKWIILEAPRLPFSLYFEGHKQLSCTDNSIPTTAKIKHTARVYPVTSFQGRKLEDAYLVGFEEASNGDYQDALFLIENVVIAK